MQAFLEYLVKGLVQHPETVTVTPVVKDALTVYELRMHPDDVGKDHRAARDDDQRHPFAAPGGQRQKSDALHAGNCRGHAAGKSLRIDLLTLFPEMFTGPIDVSIIQRARKNGLLDLRVHNLRDYTHDNYKTVDDRPFWRRSGHGLEAGADF